jgi:tetrahydromethanopterin S-methyltransferase subunit D
VAHRSGALAANRDLVGVPGCTRLRSIIQETFLAAAMIAMHVTSRPAAITLAVGTSTPTRRSAPGEHLSTLCPAAVDQVHVQAALIDDTAVGRHDVARRIGVRSAVASRIFVEDISGAPWPSGAVEAGSPRIPSNGWSSSAS